jgi:hypothetical protein
MFGFVPCVSNTWEACLALQTCFSCSRYTRNKVKHASHVLDTQGTKPSMLLMYYIHKEQSQTCFSCSRYTRNKAKHASHVVDTQYMRSMLGFVPCVSNTWEACLTLFLVYLLHEKHVWLCSLCIYYMRSMFGFVPCVYNTWEACLALFLVYLLHEKHVWLCSLCI